MRICIVNPIYDTKITPSLMQLRQVYRHDELLSAALARRNHEVVVVQAFHEERIDHHNSVEFRYTFAPERSAPRLAGGRLGIPLFFRSNLKRIIEVANDVRPDAVHMIGVTLLQPLLEVSRWCEDTGRPLTASYHGGAPRREPWLHGL